MAVVFLAVVFLAVVFLAVVFLAGLFLAADFVTAVFLEAVCLEAAPFAVDFLAAVVGAAWSAPDACNSFISAIWPSLSKKQQTGLWGSLSTP